jgi:ankyrin repeat protein
MDLEKKILEDNVEYVKEYFLKNENNINDLIQREGCKETALCISAGNGNLKVLKFLVDFKGISLNYGGVIGGGKYTPLCVAVEFGHVDCVKELLEKGADVNENNSGKWFPLYLAIEFEQVECLKLLLKQKNLNFDLKGYNGTALDFAKKIENETLISLIESSINKN